jgi:hypothetical protein
MSDDELAAIEARANAATPGPWREVAESGDWWIEHTNDDTREWEYVCSAGLIDPQAGPWKRQEDIDFVVAARTDIPALVAEVRRLREIERAVLDLERLIADTLGILIDQVDYDDQGRELWRCHVDDWCAPVLFLSRALAFKAAFAYAFDGIVPSTERHD